MPKIVKTGIFGPENEIPEKPLPGLRAKCIYCLVVLEVLEGDNCYNLVIKRKNGMMIIGWELKCPDCGRKVFISYTKPIPEVYFKNGNSCKKIIEDNLEDWVTEGLN